MRKWILLLVLIMGLKMAIGGEWIVFDNLIDTDEGKKVYDLEAIGGGYKISNFYGDYYFFDWYSLIKDHKTNDTLIEESNWIIEYYNNNKWRDLDLYVKSLRIEELNSSEIILQRISTDFENTLIENYYFSRSSPKISINFTGQEREYRLRWQNTGIKGNYLQSKIYDNISFKNNFSLDTDLILNQSKLFNMKLFDVMDQRYLYSLSWDDIFDLNQSKFIYSEYKSKDKKLDIYFGEWINNSFYLDPSWHTPSYVYDCSEDGDCDDTIDGNTNTDWAYSTYSWDHFIVYDLNDYYSIEKIQFFMEGDVTGDTCGYKRFKYSNTTTFDLYQTRDFHAGDTKTWHEDDVDDVVSQYIKIEDLYCHVLGQCQEYNCMVDNFYEFQIYGEVYTPPSGDSCDYEGSGAFIITENCTIDQNTNTSTNPTKIEGVDILVYLGANLTTDELNIKYGNEFSKIKDPKYLLSIIK